MPIDWTRLGDLAGRDLGHRASGVMAAMNDRPTITRPAVLVFVAFATVAVILGILYIAGGLLSAAPN